MAKAFDIMVRRRETPLAPPRQSPPPPRPPRRRGGGGFWYFLFIVAAAGIIIWWNQNSTNSDESGIKPVTIDRDSSAPATTPTPTTTPTPAESSSSPPTIEQPKATEEPQPTLDKKSIKIQVLNGGGVKGLAATVKTELEKDGWSVAAIGTAKNRYLKTYIYYGQEEKKTAAEELAKSLSQRQPLLQKSSIVGKYDIMVVAGTPR